MKRKYVKSKVLDVDMFGFKTKETTKQKKQRLRVEQAPISFTPEQFYNAKHLISYSGGKDSTVLLLTAMQYKKQGKIKDFEVIFCDTGNESIHTYGYIRYLEMKFGVHIKKLEVDFTPYQALLLASENPIQKAYGSLFQKVGTRNAFLNMILYKKCFPHGQSARFCTGILKELPSKAYELEIEGGNKLSHGLAYGDRKVKLEKKRNYMNVGIFLF